MANSQTMAIQENRRYRISEVSDMVGVPSHVLRQWETRFTQLKPKRDRANRRYYLPEDVEIARRIKELLRNEKLTSKGASRRLSQELFGEGRPRTNREARELIDKIENEVRAMRDILDRDITRD